MAESIQSNPASFHPTVARSLLERVVANVLAAAAAGREVIDCGPFRAFLSYDTDMIYLNYAVPVAPCEDWGQALRALREVFVLRKRRPRLEYFPGLWPDLLPALQAAGYAVELEAPFMLLTPSELVVPPSTGARVQLLNPTDPTSDFMTMYEVGAKGFGMAFSEDLAATEARARAQLDDGVFLAALSWWEGQGAACGSLSCSGEVAELAGVATLPELRRRGLASELCHRLMEAGFAQGLTLVWLAAANVAACRVYEALGFQHGGVQIHCSILPGLGDEFP